MDYTTIWVCSDCALHRETGGEHDYPEAWRCLPKADISNDNEIIDFDTTWCAACGTTLAGARHKYALWS